MYGLFAALFGKIVGSAAFTGAVQVAMFMAFKLVLVTLMVSVLAIVLNNFIIAFITDLISAAANEFANHPDAGDLSNLVFNLEGIGAYLGGLLKLQESFSVLMAGFSIGAVRSFIPFIGK